MALGSFSAGEGGIGKLDLILDEAIPDKQWNLMMITVESESGQGSTPNARHSIAGRFPTASSAGRPGELPRTGGATIENAPPPVVDPGVGAPPNGAALTLCAAALALGAFAFGRKTTSRKTMGGKAR